MDGDYLEKGKAMRSNERCYERKISSPDKPFTERLESTPVSLDWLCHIVWRRWPIILGLCILGGLCGFVIALVYPQYWTATALIEIGKVANEPLESASYTIDQLRDPAFSYTLLEQLKHTEAEAFTPDVKRSIVNLQVRKLRESELIELTIDGSSPQSAKKISAKIFNSLRAIHLKKHDILVDSLRSRYEEIENNISKIKAELSILLQLKKSIVASTEKEGLIENLLLMSLVTQNNTQLSNLNNELFALKLNLSPAHTINTKLVTDIYVTETPTVPSISIFVAGGVIVTLFLGLIWLAISRSNSESASDLS